MELTAKDWDAISALFPEALELGPSARKQFLDQRCSDQPHVRAELESLLAAAALESQTPLKPVIVCRGELASSPGPEGELLGPWRVGALLGSGGMGDVFAAERADGAYEQQVAIKLLKRGIDTELVLKRFLRERQILARLSHPNIARLLDAGAAPDGRPYLVMERVEGLSIDQWCERRHPTVRGRIEMVCEVCEAVHAAHRQRIVHRDLKPSNILVTDNGEIRLLDFGVSKLAGEEAEQTHTLMGNAPLTPDYAAPEQLLGQTVTPATDVYALGLVLYRLLAGALPHSRTSVVAAVFAAAKEGEVIRPSTTLRRQALARDAEKRRSEARELEGDIDQIVLKALQRDPARRYADAAELADDLRRHLDGRPVTATGDSLAYRARKFVRRHWVPVTAGSVATFALLVGLTAALWQAHLAQGRAEQLRQVVEFQAAMLKHVNVGRLGAAWMDNTRAMVASNLDQNQPATGPEDATAILAGFDRMRAWAQPSEVVRKTLGEQLLAPERAEIGKRFSGDPLTEARMHASLGDAYADLGDYANAITEVQRAVDLQTRALGADHPDTLSTRMRLAAILGDSGDTNAAPAAEAVYVARRRLLGEHHRETLAAEYLWASQLMRHGDYAQARALAEPLLAQQQRLFGKEDPDSLASALLLTNLMSMQGQYAEAIPLANDVLAARRRLLGDDDPLTLKTMDELVYTLNRMGREKEARTLGEEQLALRRRVLGEDHPDTLKTLLNLSLVMEKMGDTHAYYRLTKQAYDGYRRALGPDHPASQSSAVNYAILLRDYAGNLPGALSIFRNVVAVRTRLSGADHPDTLNAQVNVANALDLEGKFPEALGLLRQTLATERRVLGEDNPTTLETWGTLAGVLVDSGDYRRALGELGPLHDATQRVLGNQSQILYWTTQKMAVVRSDLGDSETARAMLQEALADERKVLGDQHPDVLDTETALAEVLHRLHRDVEAQSLASAVVSAWTFQTGLDSTHVVEEKRALAGYDLALGQKAKARELRRQADESDARRKAQWATLDRADS